MIFDFGLPILDVRLKKVRPMNPKSRSKQADGDVGHHSREILVGSIDEFTVLNGNRCDDQVRDANTEYTVHLEAIPEPGEVGPETLALRGRR